jgi:hypothetical protein
MSYEEKQMSSWLPAVNFLTEVSAADPGCLLPGPGSECFYPESRFNKIPEWTRLKELNYF